MVIRAAVEFCCGFFMRRPVQRKYATNVAHRSRDSGLVVPYMLW